MKTPWRLIIATVATALTAILSSQIAAARSYIPTKTAEQVTDPAVIESEDQWRGENFPWRPAFKPPAYFLNAKSVASKSFLPANVADPMPDPPFVEKKDEEREGKEPEWRPALKQSLYFLGIEHGFRLLQPKTRRELKGPFFKEYFKSAKSLSGWSDGDGVFTNYVAHAMQGAAAGNIRIQNDPQGREEEFSRAKPYWQSRFKALGWAAGYSTQFELGPVSEAAIGNVGLKKGTMGWVDLVITPLGGFGWLIGEDALDRYVILPLERRTSSLGRRRFYRVIFNPTRGFANLLRRKVPWHRDTRSLEHPQPEFAQDLQAWNFRYAERSAAGAAQLAGFGLDICVPDRDNSLPW